MMVQRRVSRADLAAGDRRVEVVAPELADAPGEVLVAIGEIELMSMTVLPSTAVHHAVVAEQHLATSACPGSMLMTLSLLATRGACARHRAGAAISAARRTRVARRVCGRPWPGSVIGLP